MTSLNPEIKNKAAQISKLKFKHTDVSNEFMKQMLKLSLLQTAALISETGKAPKEGHLFSKGTSYNQDEAAAVDTEPISASHVIKNKIDLPSLPNVFRQITEVMSDPNSSAKDFAEIISKDPALSARLLRIVNSAFYGFRSRVDTISRAVAIIGTNDLYSLSLSMSVLNIFDNIPDEFVDMHSFWKHCIACGMIAKIIATHQGFSNTEQFFVAGLLHDIGRLVLYTYLPDETNKALVHARLNGDLLFKSESKILGFNHSRIGGMLMKKWRLPPRLDHMVRFHHKPETSSFIHETAIVHVADIVSNAFDFGTTGERFVPPLSKEVWDVLNLPTSLIEKVVDQTNDQIAEVTQILTS
jgi:HD-like signal output (HDOD) protein